jgi:hypothetical protein
MTGRFYIDGQDTYSLYRIFVTEDGYKDLVAFPSLKTAESNNWAEEDGEEFDLSAPALDTRELSVNFAFHGNDSRFGSFIERLSDRSYHQFHFNEIGKTYRLRLVSQPGMIQVSTLGTFSLRFADDFPLSEYSYVAPQSSIVPYQGYELDGRDLSEYGVYILQGSEAEILKSPAAKKNLLRNANSMNGAIYDGEYVTFQTKEVKLNCLMQATSLPEFWRNYHAFLYDLTRPDEHILYVDFTGYNYPCYYKRCSVSKFTPNGKVWFQFSLDLVFTSFRVEDDEFLLASEIGEWIITEDEDGFAIDLSIYGN